NLVAISNGAFIGWPSPSLLILRNPETALGGIPITTEEESRISSVPYLSAFICVPVYSYINQRWGRKRAGYITGVSFIISWLFIIFGDSIKYLMVARVFMGVGASGVNVCITMYCGEIAEDTVRGVLGTFPGPYVTIREMAIISIIIPIIFLVALFFLPESPMYLITKERDEEAMESLLWLCGNKKAAEVEMEKLKIVVNEFKSNSSKHLSLKELLSFRGTRKAISIAFILAVLQQFTGMYVVLSFCASIFEMAGTDLSPNTSSLIAGLMLLVGSLLSAFLTDLVGRRIVTIATELVIFLTLGALGIYFYLQEIGFDVSVLGLLPVFCISICFISISSGLPTLVYIIVAEIFTPGARGIATLTTNGIISLLAFLIMKFYPILLTVIQGYGCFWIFSVFSLMGAIYSYFFIPETKNRSIESILRELNGETDVNIPEFSLFKQKNKIEFDLHHNNKMSFE
ncbi:hypothetical protein L9F63_027527, partial [Diploptera punctata]